MNRNIAGRKKTLTLFPLSLVIQDKSLLSLILLSRPVIGVIEAAVFEDYSPVRSLASLRLQSLRLLFCLVTGVTEASVFETTLLSGHQRH